MSALKSGRILALGRGGESIRIGGVSGISGAAKQQNVYARKYLREDDVLALAGRGSGAFDILLTHEAPAGLEDRMRHGGGSPILRLLVEKTQPSLAFFGHHGCSFDATIGRTRVFALADCGYRGRDDWLVAQGAIAVIHWQDGRVEVERIEDDWLRLATRTSWRRWR